MDGRGGGVQIGKAIADVRPPDHRSVWETQVIDPLLNGGGRRARQRETVQPESSHA